MRKFKFLLGVILATALCIHTFARRRAGLRRDGAASEVAANKPEPASVHMDPERSART